MTIEKRKKDPNDDEKVKFCFRGTESLLCYSISYNFTYDLCM